MSFNSRVSTIRSTFQINDFTSKVRNPLMKKYLNQKFVTGVIGLLVLASGAFFLVGGSSSGGSGSALPNGIVPAPAGIIGGSLVGKGQNAWVLTNTGTASNAQLLSVTTGKVTEIIPTSINSTSIAFGGMNMIAVGAGTTTSGFVSFYNVSTKVEMGVIATAGPVSAVCPVPNSKNFYAMISTPTSKAVQILNPSLMRLESFSLPLPSDAVSFVASADGGSIVVLKTGGKVTYISTTTGQVTQTFQVGADPVAVAVNPDATRLYVLKGVETLNVAVIDTSTEAVLRAMAAPRNTHSIAVTSDGTSLIDFVGTPTIGNIQVFAAN
jgi:hypothetical protein